MQLWGIIDLNKINKYKIIINKDVSVFKFVIINDNEPHGDYSYGVKQDNTIIGGCNAETGILETNTVIEMFINYNAITDLFIKNNIMAFHIENSIVYQANFISDYKKTMIKIGAYNTVAIERTVKKIKNSNLPYSYFE